MRQVQNWASHEKRIRGLNASMSLEELRAYCESNSAEPEDENEPYVIGYKAETQKDLCIVWSSKKLIQLQHKSHTFSVDGTYKLMSLNWPILVNFYN
jgi:muramidase (phage lysozyme)